MRASFLGNGNPRSEPKAIAKHSGQAFDQNTVDLDGFFDSFCPPLIGI